MSKYSFRRSYQFTENRAPFKKLESHCYFVWLLCMNLTPITEKTNWRRCSSFLSQEKLKRCGIRRDFERATNIECLCSRQKTNIWRRNWILQTVCVKWISVLFVSPENDSFAIGTFYWPWKCQHLNENTNSNFSTNIKFEYQLLYQFIWSDLLANLINPMSENVPSNSQNFSPMSSSIYSVRGQVITSRQVRRVRWHTVATRPPSSHNEINILVSKVSLADKDNERQTFWPSELLLP